MPQLRPSFSSPFSCQSARIDGINSIFSWRFLGHFLLKEGFGPSTVGSRSPLTEVLGNRGSGEVEVSIHGPMGKKKEFVEVQVTICRGARKS